MKSMMDMMELFPLTSLSISAAPSDNCEHQEQELQSGSKLEVPAEDV
jgi:hypothetical protein